MNTKMLVQYVRDEYRRPIGVVVAVPSEDSLSSDAFCIGWSKCCKKDKFDKQLGKTIALGRTKYYNHSKFPRYWTYMPQCVKSTVEQMEQRAKRYFK